MLSLVAFASVAAAEDRQPNIIYILADDLGYAEVGCYGQTKIETPHIDRLAKEGMRFSQHYSGAPVCAPARCVLMTGRHTGHSYVRGNRGRARVGQLPIPRDSVTVAKLLKQIGYTTAFIGKWGLGGPGTSGLPHLHGFDHWFGYLDQWMAHSHYPEYLWRNNEKVVLEGNADGKQGQYTEDLFAEEALAFLRGRKKNEPFFLYLAPAIPHVSLHVPEASLKQYEGRWPETPYPGAHYAGHKTPRAAYAAMVSHMDRNIGKIMALLKERGLDENTLVIFTSDNGPTYAGGADSKFFESAGPLRGLKGSLYEGGIRVPMIARWPGKVRAGATSDHASAFWDVLPTLVELAGGTAPKDVDGKSFLPTLLGSGRQQVHDHLYWEHPAGGFWQAVRMGDWKAVRRNVRRGNRRIELYNLKDDVGEQNDVADQHPEIVRRAEALMRTSRSPSEFFPITDPLGFRGGRDRTWIGPLFWANRLQDWRLRNRRLECVSGAPMRTVHCLTHRLADRKGSFRLRVRTGISGGDGATGFLVGAGGKTMDYRAAAIVHGVPGKGGGIFAGIDARGHVFIRDNEQVHVRAPSGMLPRRGWKAAADSFEPNRRPDDAVDGDPSTFWHTEWRQKKPPHPHELRIDLGKETKFNGFAYLPRQPNAPGRLDGYTFSISEDGKTWREVAAGRFPDGAALQEVWFANDARQVSARFFKLASKSAHNRRPVAAVAEVYLLAGQPRAQAQTPEDIVLQLDAAPDGTLRVTAREFYTTRVLGEATRKFDPARLTGNVALVSDSGRASGRAWFREWRVTGDKVDVDAARAFGPIAGTQHTLSRGVMKMTAQLMPVGGRDPKTAYLEVDGKRVASAPVVKPGYTATFRVAPWDARRDAGYRVVYDGTAYAGVIRRDPTDKETIVLAGLSCNHNNSHRIGRAPFDWTQGMWFPHADLAAQVKKHAPDVLFFAGDQIYEGRSPTPADRAHIMDDYMYKWLLWVWAYGDLTATHPTITIPDDHDVFQGNLWGEGGRKTSRDNRGGYVHPAAFVKMVERTQTSHLPDPFDPTPVEQGIGVYYTAMTYGRVSFAILEDRKFKSGCAGRLPPTGTRRPDHINDPSFDVRKADVEGLKLLGDRQLAFLRAWAVDWEGADLKVALSQTVFANLATHHGAGLQYLRADLDSNGWPQTGRNKALRELRRAFAFHVAGDQHLATLAQHGLDAFNDGPWSFCVPAIANFYPRKWEPKAEGRNRPAGAPAWLGEHRDGFLNRVTMHAVANPGGKTGREPADLHDNMPGFGIVRMNKAQRTITFECWARHGQSQYVGWPKTIRQLDNHARPAGHLPQVESEQADPVVQLIDEATGEVVYTVRIKGKSFRPPVFEPGKYTVKVGERTLRGLEVK